MKDGDIFLTNDPWKGTGHLHDFTFVTPTFHRGKVVALFASTCHVVDIGGRGMTADARQVYEEGLYIPLMRFARAGVVDETLIEIVRANVREPVQVVGDLYSLATCNEIGSRRLTSHDGRVRHRRSRPARAPHPGEVEAGLARCHPPDQAGQIRLQHAHRRLRQADRPRRHHDHRRERHRRRLRRHLGRLRLRHQCAALLHRGLYLVRREVHRGAEGAEQRGLAVGDPRDGAGRLDPQRSAAGAGLHAPCHRPDAARRGVRMPAPGAGRQRAGRGHLLPVEPDRHGRAWARRRRPGRQRGRAAFQRHELPCRRHRRAARQGRAVGHGLPERRAQRADARSTRRCRRS